MINFGRHLTVVHLCQVTGKVEVAGYVHQVFTGFWLVVTAAFEWNPDPDIVHGSLCRNAGRGSSP